MLYRLELGEAITSKEEGRISEVNRKLAEQLRTLNEIARKENIPVIVTNQVYSLFTKEDENKVIEKVSKKETEKKEPTEKKAKIDKKE